MHVKLDMNGNPYMFGSITLAEMLSICPSATQSDWFDSVAGSWYLGGETPSGRPIIIHPSEVPQLKAALNKAQAV